MTTEKVSSGSGDGPDCAIGGVSPAYPSAATEPAPSASRHFPPTDLLHRTDRDPDGKRPPRAGALASSSPARHYPERREGRNAGGLGGSGGGGANFFYFREEAEVSAALGYSPVRMPDQKQNEKQNKTKKNNGKWAQSLRARGIRLDSASGGARSVGDVCTSGASVAGCGVVAGGVGRKALAAEAGTPGAVFPPAANGTA